VCAFAFLGWILTGTCGLITGSFAAAETTHSVRVALFADSVCTDAKSREAAYKVLKAADGVQVDKVSTQTICDGSLAARYDVLILPGGTGSGEAKAIGIDGGKIVTDFVKNGKGVIAICAGGYYVAEGGGTYTGTVDLINARNHDGDHWARGEGYIAVEVLGGKDGDSSRTMWFENGPIFVPGEMKDAPAYTPLVRYVSDFAAAGAPKGQMQGRDAVLAANYGEGRVVAFGPHPELSPNLNHWLVNAVRWAAEKGAAKPTVEAVLEGKKSGI